MRADLWMRQQGLGCAECGGKCGGLHGLGTAYSGDGSGYCSTGWVMQGDAGYACYGDTTPPAPAPVAVPVPVVASNPIQTAVNAVKTIQPVVTQQVSAPAPAPAPSGPSPAQIAQQQAAQLAYIKAQQDLQAAQQAIATAKSQAEHDAAVAAARAASAAADKASQAVGSVVELAPGDATGANFYAGHSVAPGEPSPAGSSSGGSGAWLAIAAAVALALAGGS